MPDAAPHRPVSVAYFGKMSLALLFFLPWINRPAWAFEDAEVRAMIASPREASAFPGSGGIWCGRERVVTIDGEGNTNVREHLIAQVFDPVWGKQRFRPYLRSYWSAAARVSVIRARVWHSREKSEDLDPSAVTDSVALPAREVPSCLNYRMHRVMFPKLKTGDFVELILVWGLPIAPGDQNVNYFVETFGAEEPVAEQRLTILQPAAANPGIRFLGPDLLRRTTTESGFRRRVHYTGNLPGRGVPLLETPWSHLPEGGDTLGPMTSQLLFTSFSSWKEVGSHFGGQWTEAAASRDDAMDRLVSQTLAAGTSPETTARALEEFVRNEIRTIPVPVAQLGLRPLKAFAAMRDRAGTERDKTCLLFSLLRAAGFQAYPVLLRNQGGIWKEDFPCPAQLDRYLVLVRRAGNPDLWLDAVGDGKVRSPRLGLLLLPTDEAAGEGEPEGLIPFSGLTEVSPAGRSDSRR